MASKTWAPRYEATVEMPILLITLRTPLPSAFTRLRTAFSGAMSVMMPRRTRSSTDSIARYGLTAAAPYPMSRATWWTSRTSPASTMSPAMVRSFWRTRWWCTAEVSSSDGIGALSASESRSDSTMKRLPSAMCAETSAQISRRRASSAAPPPSTSYRPETLAAEKPGRSPSLLTYRILASSSLSMTGNGRTSWRQCAGVASRMLTSGPMRLDSEVTSSSRIASSGGLVTCAKSCEK